MKLIHKRVFFPFFAAALAVLIAPGHARAGESGPSLRCRWANPVNRAAMDVTFSGNPMVVMLPGENLEVSSTPPGGKVQLYKNGKPYMEDARLNLTAPSEPGSYYIPMAVSGGGAAREIELCVQVPYKATARKLADGWEVHAGGETIGKYRHTSRSGNLKVQAHPESYQPPVWWLKMEDGNMGFEIMPGILVGELVVPTEDTGLRHSDMAPVRYDAWQAIVAIRAKLPEIGVPGSAMKLISMFRAPQYNRGVGSNAFGRHIYGDAFDFYIDIKGDGKASDLNKDGKLDRRDAYPVVALLEDMQADSLIPVGGIGVYNSVAGDHVVTMHLDLRGHRATWGYHYSAGGKRSEFSWASRRFAEVDRQWEQESAARAAKEGKKYYPPNREPLR